MIPTISASEFARVIKNDMYYENIDYATENEKRIACDLSGCSMGNLQGRIPVIEYAYRYNSKILRNTFDRDFVAVMSFMFPTWNKKDWKTDSSFEPVRYLQIEKNDEKWCICGHWIKHCCIWKNKITGTSVLVGNECIKKISANAYRDMLSCVKKQKERDEAIKEVKRIAKQKQWEDYNATLKRYHFQRETILNLVRDELVAKVEAEEDTQQTMRTDFDKLKQRASMLERQLTIMMDFLRPCVKCKRYAVLKDEPEFKTLCKTCYA